MTFDEFDRGTPAFEGRAIRKQVTINVSADESANDVDVLLYLSANAEGPVPVLLELDWATVTVYL